MVCSWRGRRVLQWHFIRNFCILKCFWQALYDARKFFYRPFFMALHGLILWRQMFRQYSNEKIKLLEKDFNKSRCKRSLSDNRCLHQFLTNGYHSRRSSSVLFGEEKIIRIPILFLQRFRFQWLKSFKELLSSKIYLLHLKLLEVVPKNHKNRQKKRGSCSVKLMELCDDVMVKALLRRRAHKQEKPISSVHRPVYILNWLS